jgi:phosphonate transport system substrate-binding protein
MTVARTRLTVLFVLFGLLVSGCNSQPAAPPTISDPMISDPTPQEPGKEVGISVDVSSAGGVTLTYTWNADGGEIVRGQGSPAITYRVPEEPGTYNVRVKVEWDGQNAEKITTIEVKGATQTSTPQSTQEAPATPTEESVLGSEENPIDWSLVPSGETQRVTSGAQKVADLLHDETGLYFNVNVTSNYDDAVGAMCSQPPEAHMGSLSTFAYVRANKHCGVEAELINVRYGSSTYNGQIIARSDSDINNLTDLAEKTFCRPDPLSTSGWIIPKLTLRAAGINPETDLEIVEAGSHDMVVDAVYNGDCDAGATYVDARESVKDDYPDVLETIKILEVTTDIPNDGIQFVSDLDEDLKTKIVEGFLTISKTEKGQEALNMVYGSSTLEKREDQFYDSFRELLQEAGMSIEELQE